MGGDSLPDLESLKERCMGGVSDCDGRSDEVEADSSVFEASEVGLKSGLEFLRTGSEMAGTIGVGEAIEAGTALLESLSGVR